MMNRSDFVVDFEEMLKGAEAPVTDECCIYRVPFGIRRLKEDAYTPTVVSIGPFHHNRHPRLHSMERHKLMYCKAFLERTKTSLDSWIHYVQEVELEFRRCYSEAIEFNKEELVKIILVDCGFILELFLRDRDDNYSHTFLSIPWLSTHIRLDLLLLENQLPFFVLQNLFNLSFSTTTNNIPSFIQLTFDYFSYYNTSKLKSENVSIIRHFTDLLRTFHLQHPAESRPSRTDKPVENCPSATELSEAGVRFKVKTRTKCLLELGFSGGVLEIPQLDVDDSTELLFRNMVALEQCHYPSKSYITDYAKVLDFLINTSRDVDILIRKRVLVNWLGDTDSVAKMLNALMQNVTETTLSFDYFRICQDLSAFHRNPWNNLKSTLRRDYCKSPWQTAATIAAIVILVLSLVQTVCSILQVIQK
ncbi:hypothetical protein VNO80_18154 [Phaseolus coccineus]|uniref:Uncharacterized protein n=1 Tax=Phaseolus coccineus TaxID=3886 RepID=A0AAN9MDU1_PHACN